MEPLKKKDLIAQGAEANIRRGEWKGRELVIKERVAKGYRLPELDQELRRARTKKEARLIREAKKAGVPTPIIYDVVPEEHTIVIQWFPGHRVMECIEQGMGVDMSLIGEFIGKLHSANLSHGDLTTSNILYHPPDQGYSFIDFSLGEFQVDLEEKGVDLHLLKEALVSVHENALDLYEQVLEGYLRTYPEGEEVIRRTKEIESRGRYQ